MRSFALFCLKVDVDKAALTMPASGKKENLVLRHRSDLRTLLFIASYFITLTFLWLHPPAHWWGGAVGVVVLSSIAWFNAVITHNVVHYPLWHSRIFNRVTQVALSLTYGFPVSDYLPGHNLSHHRYTQTRRDVMRTTKVQFHFNLLNALTFFFFVAFDVAAANGKYARFAGGQWRAWSRQRWLEAAVTWSVKLVLFYIDWKKAFLFVLIPHLWAVWSITTVNYLQHDGCDADHPYNHSRNFVGRIFNWFHFNAGYHGIHHSQPGLHWSHLPQMHAQQLAPYIHPALEQRSLVVYLWRTFIRPGQRVRYDMTPVILPLEGPDEDWIGGTLHTEAGAT